MNWNSLISEQLDILLSGFEKKNISGNKSPAIVYNKNNQHVLCEFDSTGLYLKEFSVSLNVAESSTVCIFFMPTKIVELLQDSILTDTKVNVKFSENSVEEITLFINGVFKNEWKLTTYTYKSILFKICVEILIGKTYETLDCYIYPTEELEMPILSKKYFYKPLYVIFEKFFKRKVNVRVYNFNS